MMEKPILFNTEMVRAILNGSKTQTRRLIKRRYDNTVLEMKTDKYGTRLIEIQKDEEGVTFGKHEDGSTWRKLRAYIEPKPAYKRGDILYVRETWNYGYVDSDCKECCHPECWFEEDDYKKKDSRPRFIINRFWYKADKDDEADMDGLCGRWRPSIHMPKEAARIWLKVTNVRCERLQDMDEDDAYYEGFRGCPHELALYFKDGSAEPCHVSGEGCPCNYWYCNHSPQEGFGLDIWDKTIKPDDLPRYGWNANPWVWVIHFERIRERSNT